MKKVIPFILIILLVLFLALRNEKKIEDTLTFYEYFDTITTIKITGSKFSETEKKEIEKLLKSIHETSDRHNSSGLLYKLNMNKEVNYNLELAEMLAMSVQVNEFHEQFNIAIAPVAKIWEKYRNMCYEEDKCLVPTQKELISALLNDDNSQIMYHDKITIPNDMELDLGAVAKGYAADRLSLLLHEFGYDDYTLNLGGNVAVGGRKKPYVIGIANPVMQNTYFQTVNIKNKSVVTSGDYERFYEVKGVRYHHLLNTQTLFPSTYMHSVTVIDESSLLADVYSTLLFNLPVEEALKLADKINMSVIIFDLEENIHYSKEALIYEK